MERVREHRETGQTKIKPGDIDGEIGSILARQFGENIPLAGAHQLIALIIRTSTRSGKFVPRGQGETRVESKFGRLSVAVAEIIAVVPDMLIESKAILEEMKRRGASSAPSVIDYWHSHQRLERFLDLAREMSPYCQPSAERRDDSRSAWHWTARVFANSIERDFKANHTDLPTRNSIKSPLIIAVHDLLALAGCEQTEETVRKALMGKSKQS